VFSSQFGQKELERLLFSNNSVYPFAILTAWERKMTESELLEHGAAFWSNAIALTAIFITILSGYIISAYVAGKDMTRSQIIIVNTLYLGISTLLLLSMLVTGQTALEMEKIAFEITVQRKHPPGDFFPYVLIVFWTFCVLLSIKFMWDIRRDKSE
jgi:hypothetical protein